jgi:hypothetical protein
MVGAQVFGRSTVRRAEGAKVQVVARATDAPSQKPAIQIAETKLPHPILYSIDVLLPFGGLQQKKTWVLDEKNPHFLWYQAWSLFEQLAGWVLTALLAAAATGLLRNK